MKGERTPLSPLQPLPGTAPPDSSPAATGDKAALRRLVRSALAELSSDARASESASIRQRLEALPAFHEAATVLLFSPLPDEPDIRPLLERYFGEKRLVLPCVAGDELTLREYCGPQRAVRGAFGIIEPDGNCPVASPEEIDFALIPGVAFTPEGLRLGRGKGYYDRLLPRLLCPTAGICFSVQLLPSLPTDPWDRKVDGVIQ